MKRLFLLSVFAIVSLCAFTQSSAKSKYSSCFVTLNKLGVSKDVFVKEFGDPIAKDMNYDEFRNIVEVLYYVENFKKEGFLVITKFTFKNNELVEQKSRIEGLSIEVILKKMSDDLDFIRRWH